ncbi:SNF2-related protein [Hydromonas duriensis]|uniref:Helicase-like protein n=1 Tax=Hydromonas duriensis TaxID=1527608 RepID=A0A4V3DJL1_9BURK|nr:SNF2-related protein [Hydromonas duriensis]TDR30335.1 helicase-like protein [Hydromonas duriensis]
MGLIEQALRTASHYVDVALFDNAPAYLDGAVATLEQAKDIAQTNAPIYLKQGDILQAKTCLEHAQSLREALKLLEDDFIVSAKEAVFDKMEPSEGISPLEKINLTQQLLSQSTQLPTFGPAQVLDKIACTQDILSLVKKLGGVLNAPKQASPAMDMFAYDGEHVSPALRQKRNDQAVDLLKQIQQGQIALDALTASDRQTLSLYSGNGGGMVREGGMKGSQFEYYTPKPIAQGMWDLLKASGFTGGAVLDPCAGTGIFSATAPAHGVTIHSVELDAVSGGINKILFGSDTHRVDVSNFERVANSTDDETYDAVISNVPFGDNKARGKNKKDDPRYQNESLEGYFILRSLDKLRPNGLAVFMSGTKFITGRALERTRIQASCKAEFLGAYRLPNKLFDSAGADVVTDVMVFKKHPKEALNIIADLCDTDPARLRDCRVLNDNFIRGRYFETDGAHFKLGASVTAQDRYGKDVEKLVSDASLPEIAKAMRKFGGSKIDWDMLGTQIGGAIVYQEGDVRIMNGQTMVFNGVDFRPVVNDDTGATSALIDSMAQYDSALSLLEEGTALQHLLDGYAACRAVGHYDSVPEWLRQPLQHTEQSSELALMVTVLAYIEAKELHADVAGFNYLTAYPKLAGAIQSSHRTSYDAVLAGLTTDAKAALKSMHRTVYDRKTAQFTPFWRGVVVAEVDIKASDFSALQNYERLLYQQGGTHTDGVLLDDFKAIMPEIDVYQDSAWCLSADGTRVLAEDDYYSGTLAEFEARTQVDLSQITDEKLKSKLLTQQTQVHTRLVKSDVSAMTFDIQSPYVDPEQVLAFLQQFVSPHYRLKTLRDDDKNEIVRNTGDVAVKFEYAPPASETHKSIQHYGKARLAVYLNSGSFSSGTKDEESNVAIRDELARLIQDANLKFDAYVHSNKSFMSRMDARINTPETMRFKQAEGTGALHIEGMSDAIKPHQYQADYVRQQVRDMGGILAYDVGLGKTLTALATVKHLHNIGAKKKTLFLVPNTTLSNWYKEVKQAYTHTDDCLFIGLRTDKAGQNTVKSSDYAADLALLTDNRYRKIYLTLEAFEKIPLQNQTLDRYINEYLPEVEDIYDMVDNTEKAKNSAEHAQLSVRNDVTAKMDKSIPYLESMGVDSLVMDEAHVFKNSRKGAMGSGESVQFLSLPDTSSRGMNAQAKAWYIRDKNKPKMDGVLALTATPVTNSPLEIYSMLVLAHGEERLQKMLGGIKSSSGFLDAFCDVRPKAFLNIHNETVSRTAFVGLKNATLLRKIFSDIATVKTAQDADVADLVKLPDVSVYNQNIEMPDEIKDTLKQAIQANQTAKKIVARSRSAGATVDKQTALEASAFHFINRVSRAVLDPDMHDEVTRYTFTDKALAKKVIDEFNSKAYKEERSRASPYTPDEAVLSTKNKQNADEQWVEYCVIRVTAWLEQQQIVIDTDEYETQAKFLAIADKHGLSLGVTLSAKLSALMANVNLERANPKAVGHKCKQMIFCDLLGMHKKIKLALTQFAQVPAQKISIVNAVEIDDAGLMQDIQDGFNGEAQDNRYEIVIANKKAEVGINLQKGSQAVHHLTTGWTPDSLQQRDGRVLRQGNYVDMVSVYHYHANGTFDEYKQQLVGTKSNWIMDLLRGTGERVAIEGALSKEDMETLAGFVGDEEAMAKAKADMLQQKQTMARQSIFKTIDGNARVYQVSQSEIKALGSFKDYALNKLKQAYVQNQQVEAERLKLEKAQAKEQPDDKLVARIQKRLNNALAVFEQQRALIDANLGSYEQLIREGAVATVTQRGVASVETQQWAFKRSYDKLSQDKSLEQGALYDEWADTVAQHEAIMADALKKTTALGEQVNLMVDDIQAWFDGEALQQGDKLVRKGVVFVNQAQTDAYYGVVESVDSTYIKYYGHHSAHRQMMTTDTFKQECQVLTPNDGGYAGAISVLAAYERERLEARNWEEGIDDVSLQTLCPQVAGSLGRAVKIVVEPERTMLVDSAMPFLLCDTTSRSPLIEAVMGVHNTQGVNYLEGRVLVDDVAITRRKLKPDNDLALLAALLEFACAHRVQLTKKDAQYFNLNTWLIEPLGAAREFLKCALRQGYSLSEWDKYVTEQQLSVTSYNYLGSVTDHIIDYLVNQGITDQESALRAKFGGMRQALTEQGLISEIEALVEKRAQAALSTKPASSEAEPDKGMPAKVQNEPAQPLSNTYVYLVGNTLGLFTARQQRPAKICDIRQVAKDLQLAIAWVDRLGKSRDLDVHRQVSKQGDVPVNSWVMDKRLWEYLLAQYNTTLNNAGITAHEVKS